jgi:very-short-patch-repair endonuclease
MKRRILPYNPEAKTTAKKLRKESTLSEVFALVKLKRQTKLESLGVRLLRFSDLDVKTNMDGVMDSIVGWIEENGGNPPCPSGTSPEEGTNPRRPPEEGTC